jgi:hypothetical protein
MAVQPDGKSAVAGETSFAARMDSRMVRLPDDEARDLTQSGARLVSLAFSLVTDRFTGVPIWFDAKIVSVGTAPIKTTRNTNDSLRVVRDLGHSGSSCNDDYPINQRSALA